jgi:hypothetical protein
MLAVRLTLLPSVRDIQPCQSNLDTRSLMLHDVQIVQFEHVPQHDIGTLKTGFESPKPLPNLILIVTRCSLSTLLPISLMHSFLSSGNLWKYKLQNSMRRGRACTLLECYHDSIATHHGGTANEPTDEPAVTTCDIMIQCRLHALVPPAAECTAASGLNIL